MNSRSRESSLKRENQQNEEKEQPVLFSEASETVHSNNDPSENDTKPQKKLKKQVTKKDTKKVKRNNWRNIFYNQIKMRNDDRSGSPSLDKSDRSEAVSLNNQNKGNDNSRNKIPILKKNFGREMNSSNNSFNDVSRQSSKPKHLTRYINF